MYELLLVLIVLVFLSLKYRETFVIKYGNPFADEDAISFDPGAKGTRIFGITPDTCPPHKPEIEAGLCYERCERGYNPVGPVCWANTQNIGIGKVQQLLSCAASGYPGRSDDGLLCRAPITWNSCKFRGLFNECWGGAEGGQIDPKKLTCDGYPQHKENIAGLCYRKCPAGFQRVPGMPYLCYEGRRGLSYGRGVGDIPPLYTFS
jgi:hypothetical protein